MKYIEFPTNYLIVPVQVVTRMSEKYALKVGWVKAKCYFVPSVMYS